LTQWVGWQIFYLFKRITLFADAAGRLHRSTATVDDYDVLAREVVGRIMKISGAPKDAPWMWTLA
jgi:hypothetical protein